MVVCQSTLCRDHAVRHAGQIGKKTGDGIRKSVGSVIFVNATGKNSANRTNMKVSIDLETTGTGTDALDPRHGQILSWSASFEDGTNEYGLWSDPDSRRRLHAIVLDKSNILIGHNVKFDISFLEAAYGVLPDYIRWEDTLLLAWLLNENEESLSLHHLCATYVGTVLKKYKDYGVQGDLFETVEGVETKCKQDTEATLRLYKHLRSTLDTCPTLVKVYENLYCPLIRAVVEMERTGIPIDIPRLTHYSKRWAQAKRAACNRWVRCVGWPLSPARNAAVSQWLFGTHGLVPTGDMLNRPKQYRMSSKPLWKVNRDVLSEYTDNKAVAALLAYRDYDKLSATYAASWLFYATTDSGRIHTHFIQCRSPKYAEKSGDSGTATGRWASSDPVNMQTIPRKGGLKRCVVAPEGYKIVYADYGQLELRVMAHVSGDPAMVEALNSGADLHQLTMDALGIKNRTVAKNCNFGLLYLIGAHAFQRQLWVKAGIRADLPTVERWIRLWYEKYAGIPAYQTRVARILAGKHEVTTLVGRKRRFSTQELTRGFDECHRRAVNATVQGSAADLIGMSMLRFMQQRREDTRFFLQVHDSVGLLVAEDEAQNEAELLKYVMENIHTLRVPLIANVGVGRTLEEAENNAH